MKYVFFGGEPLGLPTLQALHEAGYTPSLVVCNPDRPAGRGKQLTAPAIKNWAVKNNIPVAQPERVNGESFRTLLAETEWDLFIVVAYNKILPKWLIELPKHQTINVHPSLLPKLRGASPIRSAILQNEPEHVGVSIMQMDEAMDSGPLLAQERLDISMDAWPLSGPDLDALLIEHGAELLIDTLPKILADNCTPRPQNHEKATYCGKLDKSMAELAIDPYNLPNGNEAFQALLTIQAFAGIGDAWFTHNDVRYKVKSAHLEDGRLVIGSVVPAGKSVRQFDELF